MNKVEIKQKSIKMVKVTDRVHSRLISRANYRDSLSDVIERLLDFEEKNRKEDQK